MIGGRYSLDRKIGRGGMGSVWLGRDEVLDRPVAIKLVGMMPGDSGPDVQRAEREARIAASLSHPHIVSVFDLVIEDDQQWLVMEYVAGTTLAELVRQAGPLPPEQVAPMLGQVSLGLAAAHAAGVVHRDVKPSNILVRDDGDVKLSDFGIARSSTDASLTQTGLVTGSPAYLAPEVASGRQATPSSDVWSLGATAFHALAGRPPYEVGDNVLGALYQIVNSPPPRLADAGALAPMLEGTMVTDPSQRWSADDVARFLVTGEVPTPPVVPGFDRATSVDSPPAYLAPEPTQPRRSEPSGRRWVLPTAAATLIVVLAAVLVVLLLQDDPQPNVAPAVDGTSSTAPTTPSSSSPSSPTTSPTTTARPVAADMEQFAANYVATASSNPTAGFALLTKAYQAASGGLRQYTEFWGAVRNARLNATPSADPASLKVSYNYTYSLLGQGRKTENITLTLSFDPDTGSYLIAGASSG